MAIAATKALDYSFGAVDIVFNEHHNQLYVLEVNANPGMEGTTLEKYSDAIVKWVGEQP
jgi:D-alanine-D-alanine ligase-like ATP-grasp enzyme